MDNGGRAGDAKQAELAAAKRAALLLLLAAAAVFVVTALLPKSVWVDGVKAVAEAAMVGALADWFAVVALFRKVPLPLISRHTAIIPRNKDRIADNLAHFVQDQFLAPDTLVALIQRHDPAQLAASWLQQPANGALLGGYALKLAGAMLDVTDDARIQAFIRRALHAALDKADLTQAAADILAAMTAHGRHQALLDDAIAQLIALLRQEHSRVAIATLIADWLKREHPRKEKILPTAWLGEHGADLIADALDSVLRQIGDDPQHALRQRFDGAVQGFVQRLQSDPALQARADDIKRYLRDDPAFNLYAGQLWNQFRAWLKQDLAAEESGLHRNVAAMGAWIGNELASNGALRASLNSHLEQLARAAAPDFALFLTGHISDTVKRWDPADLSRQVELNIGKDLQYIRINGTLVGGCIGLVLYLSSLLIAHLNH